MRRMTLNTNKQKKELIYGESNNKRSEGLKTFPVDTSINVHKSNEIPPRLKVIRNETVRPPQRVSGENW